MMDDSTSLPLIDPPLRSTTLADGRTLTWQEFGVPDGRPTLYFHGGGSTSIEGGIFHREAVRNGLRLLATNRPGAGGSTLRPGRPVAAYADDLRELLDQLDIEAVACFGESNGGMITMAAAATMPDRVRGAAPINPTLPWFDHESRRASSVGTTIVYQLMKRAPRLVVALADRAAKGSERRRRLQSEQGDDSARGRPGSVSPADLTGPPPGTEPDVAALHHRTDVERAGRDGLLAELAWASHDWGFDYYAIPVALDFFCGEHDIQGPFARVLAERNPDARFHEFAYGHNGFSHPDARRRIVDVVRGYLEH